jgi:transposase
MPYFNSEAVSIHLEIISQRVPAGRHAIVLLDRASAHTCKDLPQLDNLTLLPIPPYSPELNPVEQIWDFLRQRELANRCFKGYEDIVDTCCEAWNTFAAQENLVREIASRDWAVI